MLNSKDPDPSRQDAGDDVEALSLKDAANALIEECRMVLPGIQALFGFQMVAVFDSRFADALTTAEQRMHLVAILCVTTAIALLMAPAVLHRSREPEMVSRRFVTLSSRLLMWAMAPLAVAIVLDVYIVARVIAKNRGIALAAGAVAFVGFFSLWIAMPARVRLESGES